MKNAELRKKLHEVGKRCLLHAKAQTIEMGNGVVMSSSTTDLLVELHGCIELVLEELENIDDEVEARVVVVLARLRAEGKL